MSPRSPEQVVNAMTVDVEEYFHVSGFADVIHPDDWPRFEGRVERNTYKLLEMFAAHKTSATFFVLGWVAERYPDLVRTLYRSGHEVACHGYTHRLIYQCTPEEFRADVRHAKKLLEDLIGAPVHGYRAPSFSIIRSSLWALDILADEGFRYDSSIFPIRRDRYGIPDAERFPHRWRTRNGDGLVQFPISTIRVCGFNVPVAGGGYFRLLPYPVTAWAIQYLNHNEGMPAIVYIHPWELDPTQPQIAGSLVGRFRHYVNIRTTEVKLRRLLGVFSFNTLWALLEQVSDTGQV